MTIKVKQLYSRHCYVKKQEGDKILLDPDTNLDLSLIALHFDSLSYPRERIYREVSAKTDQHSECKMEDGSWWDSQMDLDFNWKVENRKFLCKNVT